MQEFYADKGLTIIGVAVDAQGPTAAQPWYRKYDVTYPQLVDAGNALGRTIGYKVVPNQFYVDELGVFHGNLDEAKLAEKLAEPMKQIPEGFVARFRSAFQNDANRSVASRAAREFDDYPVQVAAGKSALASGDARAAVAFLERAAAKRAESAEAQTTLAAAHLAVGDKLAAVQALRAALKVDPKNWLIRKQIWAIEHPDRFYDGPVDFAWQRTQLRRESSRSD